MLPSKRKLSEIEQLVDKALAYKQAGDFAAAKKILNQVIQLQPKHQHANLLLRRIELIETVRGIT